MRARIFQLLFRLRSSYWFLPSLMALGAIVLSVVTVALDERMTSDWPEEIPWVYSNKPDGARALLATVAGSMITVAGVTFSLTLLAVSHTTSQFGPRLLTNFMRDRGNQVTLGTFIATFLYCLLVLRTVRSAEEASAASQAADLVGAFVPHISISAALLMTLCSVGVLIYFFHHVPESMNLSNVVAGVGRRLAENVDEIFPEMIGQDSQEEIDSPRQEAPPDGDATLSLSLGKDRDGFIQTMNDDGLLDLANKNDLVVQLHCRPGDFVGRGQTVLTVWPRERVTEETTDLLQDCVAVGESRTPHQNILFLVDQLVEIAARALSPGTNDPFTAMICLQWLGSALGIVGNRRNPERYRYDSAQTLRIIAPTVTFQEVMDKIFDQLRPYCATDPNAALQMMETIITVRDSITSRTRQRQLDEHADRLMAAAKAGSLTDYDLARLRAAAGSDDTTKAAS